MHNLAFRYQENMELIASESSELLSLLVQQVSIHTYDTPNLLASSQNPSTFAQPCFFLAIRRCGNCRVFVVIFCTSSPTGVIDSALGAISGEASILDWSCRSRVSKRSFSC